MNPAWLETPSVRPEPVEGFATDEKARFLKLSDEFHTFLRQPNLYDERDKTHKLSVLLAESFADFLEGFYVVSIYEAPLKQAPALLLRGMYEVMVKLLYLADKAHTRSDVQSELIVRTDSILLKDRIELRKLHELLDKDPRISLEKKEKVGTAKQRFDKDRASFHASAKDLNIPEMLRQINSTTVDQCYLTYRSLSELSHASIERMRSSSNRATEQIRVFNRTAEEMVMWYECASNFTEGALQALKQLLTPVRTEPVEVNMNPSTSSGRTGVV
jgi:hypothetical protein